ncbi:MAG TPA: hypothetical protein VLL48_02990, partial [Longimicrobiales bacterium]|nr:hypothetical protein [Longimicrobiales bacterium]
FGFMVLPGTYTATLVGIEEGEATELAGPVDFEVVPLREPALPRVVDDLVVAFRQEVEGFQHDLARTENTLETQIQKVEAMQTALQRAGSPDAALMDRLYQTRLQLLDLQEQLEGSEAKDEIGERGPPTPSNRLSVGFRGLTTTYGPTEMHRRTVAAGRAELVPIRAEIQRMADEVVPALEQALEATGAPPIEGGGG